VGAIARRVHARRGFLFAQNGEDVMGPMLHDLDGWNREDVTGTYDFDSSSYVVQPAGETAGALAAIRRMRQAGLLVTATDHFLPARRRGRHRAGAPERRRGRRPAVRQRHRPDPGTAGPTALQPEAAMNRRLRQGALLAAILMIAALPALLGAAPLRIDPGLRVDMKVLLLTASGNEAGFSAWKANLDRDGIPYDAIVADTAPPLTDATFTDGPGHGRYQAIILTDGDLVHADSTPALAQSEWDALARYESTYGIRQFSDATLPGPAHGLNFATTVGEHAANTAQLPAAGHQLFPELVGPVPIDQGSFGAQATPLDPANFTTLLTGPGGSSYLGIYTHPEDGRQEMVMTVSSNQFQTQNQLLREGIINWVTRGVHLGVDRNYFSVDVDDVFNTDAKWDPTTHTTPGDLEPTTCGNAGLRRPAHDPSGHRRGDRMGAGERAHVQLGLQRGRRPGRA